MKKERGGGTTNEVGNYEKGNNGERAFDGLRFNGVQITRGNESMG